VGLPALKPKKQATFTLCHNQAKTPGSAKLKHPVKPPPPRPADLKKREHQPVSENTIKGMGAGKHKINPIRACRSPNFGKLKKYHERPGRGKT
jgi:hypothetical protein